MHRRYPRTIAIMLAVLSAVLVLASSRIEALAWLALIWMLPLALAIHQAKPWAAAGLALLSAALFWLASVSWLLPAFVRFTGTALLPAGLLYILLCLLLALPYALFAAGYCRLRLQHGWHGPWLAAALLTLLLMLPSPIPGLPQHALHRYPSLLAILDISGTSGLVFVSTLITFLLVRVLRGLPWQRSNAMAVMLLAGLLVSGYAVHRDNSYRQEKAMAPASQWLTLGMIQPNLSRSDDTGRLYQLSDALVARHGRQDLLVWPEFPPPFSLVDNPADRQATLALANRLQQDMLVVSGYVYARDGNGYFNAAHLLQHGEIQASYFKQQLVPFFEYLPGEQWLPILRRWLPGVLQYRAGDNAAPLRLSEHVSLVTAICYEAIFPGLVRRAVSLGGNVLVNPVSDSWFGSSAGSRYHLSLAHFRAIEHRMPWLRVANSGISIAVEANGQPVAGSETLLQRQQLASVRLFVPAERGLYSRYGDWLGVACGLALLLYAGAAYRRQNNNNRQGAGQLEKST
ncbi:MAG TPA: apolipoprotein N-acyltransferase [Pseudomonadales bacterium]